MSKSSNKPLGGERTLAIPPDIAERLGPRRYALLLLWIRDVNGALEAALYPHVDEDTVLLDAGCSRGDPDIPSIARTRHAVGCDMDLAGLRANTLVFRRVLASLESLPFRDGVFDVVLCKFVVEHLEAPKVAFEEFRRVLRPGGIVAVLTPNRLSPFALVSHCLPHRLKQIVKKHLFGGHAEDTFPTRYRANTPGALGVQMEALGFVLERMQMLGGTWAFFIFSSPMAKCMRALERVQARTPGLRRFSTHMLALWAKPRAPEAV
jgi:SAM-dependent methyltransferase